MKYSAIKSYPYTVEVYDVAFDAEGRIVSETFRENLRVSFDTTGTGSLNIDTLVPLGVDTVLRNIRDRRDTLLYDDPNNTGGAAYVVWQEAPVLSAVGTLEGYTSKARKR